MKLTTLNRAMQPMINYGFIVEADIGESTGGRKPILYDVNPGKYYIIGIDISRTLYTSCTYKFKRWKYCIAFNLK